MSLVLMEPEWIPIFAGKLCVAEVLPKQPLVLPHPDLVLGGVLLSADTIHSGERSGKETQGKAERAEELGEHWDLPELPSPSHHSIQQHPSCNHRPENFFQLTVKPKVHCPSSSRCWEPVSGDGWMGFLVLDTAVWYSPEKVPSLSTSNTCILEPRSFSHQPVRLHGWGQADVSLGAACTQPLQAEPLPTPPNAHGVLALTLICLLLFPTVAFSSFLLAFFSPGCSIAWQRVLGKNTNTGQAVDGGTADCFWSPESA